MDSDLRNFLVDHSLEGIIVTDLEGNILQGNATACGLLGYPVSELEGQFAGFIFPYRSISHLLPNMLRLAREKAGFDGDIILEDAAGDSVMVRMVAEAWPLENPTRLLLRFIDWRETHQIMTQLRESNQLASLGTLTRSLSHEILNPLSIIGGYTRRLLDSLQTDSQEEDWARHVMTCVEKLESMIETIEAFLHLPPLSFEKSSLDELLDSSLDGIRREAEKRGIRIIREKVKETPPVFMDPHLLEKAFSAILLNALDRMPQGGELTLDTDHDEGHCQLTFMDSGPTLDTRQMEEDLSPLHILGNHRTHLNLAIARRIVDEHGGRFDIGTPPSEGLKVKIRLPIDRRALAREREM